MKTKSHSNKGKDPTGTMLDKSGWRIDFHRPTATAEVSQWAEELGESRVRQGTPPLFIANDADKEAALSEFSALEPEATPIAAKAKRR